MGYRMKARDIKPGATLLGEGGHVQYTVESLRPGLRPVAGTDQSTVEAVVRYVDGGTEVRMWLEDTEIPGMVNPEPGAKRVRHLRPVYQDGQPDPKPEAGGLRPSEYRRLIELVQARRRAASRVSPHESEQQGILSSRAMELAELDRIEAKLEHRLAESQE